MRMDRLVKKYQKRVLWAAILLFSGTLILTFTPGSLGDQDPAKIAGSFEIEGSGGTREKIEVTSRDFSPFGRSGRALTMLRMMLYEVDGDYYSGKLWFDLDLFRGRFDPLMVRMIQNGEFEDLQGSLADFTIFQTFGTKYVLNKDKASETYAQAAKDAYVLNHIASQFVPHVSESEVREVRDRLFTSWPLSGINPNTPSGLRDWTSGLLGATPEDFNFALTVSLRIARYLSLLTASVFPRTQEVYTDQLKQSRKVRFQYATVSDKDSRLLRRLRPITIQEVAKFYKENKSSFQSPPGAMLISVSARYDAFRKHIRTPSDEEARKYLTSHRSEFAQPDNPTPPYEEVAETVKKVMVDPKLKELAYDRTWALLNSVREWVRENSKGEAQPDSDDILVKGLDPKMKELKAVKGYEFNVQTSEYFTSRQEEDIRKDLQLGDQADFADLAFGPDRQVGDVSEKVQETDTGCHFYILHRVVEPKDLPLTRRYEERIRDIKRQEELRRIALYEARAIARTAKEQGVDAAGRKHGVSFTTTGYFSPRTEGGFAGYEEIGVSNPSISDAIFSISETAREIGDTGSEQVQGAGYVAAAMDDIYLAPVEELGKELNEARSRLRLRMRNTEKEKLRLSIIKDARYQDLLNKETPAPEEPESGP